MSGETKKTQYTEAERSEAARAAIAAGEAAGLSTRTMNKRWAAYFAAETALKAVTAWM